MSKAQLFRNAPISTLERKCVQEWDFATHVQYVFSDKSFIRVYDADDSRETGSTKEETNA